MKTDEDRNHSNVTFNLTLPRENDSNQYFCWLSHKEAIAAAMLFLMNSTVLLTSLSSKILTYSNTDHLNADASPIQSAGGYSLSAVVRHLPH